MPKPKLNQIIAVLKGVKTRVYAKLSEDHKALQKDELFKGLSRKYTSREEGGEPLPEESKKVSFKAEEILSRTAEGLTELFDTTAAQDWGNCQAKASVVVDGEVLLEDVPVTYLLFLEKQLSDLLTFAQKLPVLDPSENWEWNAGQDLFATAPSFQTRTKKVTRFVTAYEATEHHPAQIKEVTEDLFVGTWQTLKYSSALPAKRVNQIVARVDKLQKAVKYAREQANGLEVDERKIGKKVFDFLFSP